MKEKILDKLTLKLEKNNKIKLPTKVLITPNISLISRYLINTNGVIILTEEQAIIDGKEYQKKLKELHQKKVITNKQKRQEERNFFGKSHSYINPITNDRYLTLNNKIISHLNIKEKVFIIIKTNHLELYPSEEYYNEIKKR